MNKTLGCQLVGFSVLLAGLSYLAYSLAPAVARPTLVVGLVGGGFCLAFGVLAVRGRRGKALAILTLIPLCYILLGQAIMTWGQNTELQGGRATAAMITLLIALSVGMLIRIAYAGIVFRGATESKAGPD